MLGSQNSPLVVDTRCAAEMRRRLTRIVTEEIPCLMVVYRFGDNWYLLNGRVFSTLADMVSVCFESTCLDMSDRPDN